MSFESFILQIELDDVLTEHLHLRLVVLADDSFFVLCKR